MATGSPSEELVQRAHDLIGRVGLESRIGHRPAELSGGERERAAVARSLLRRPLLLLADEPTGNLDRTNAQHVTQLLLEIQQQEQTMLIVVTHNNDLANQLQKQTTLDNGQLS
jgi:lipoprotein-releasing system ATP-binding protein